MGEYRIRWARVQTYHGRSGALAGHKHMCLAERKVRLFGIIPLWWPVDDGGWRYTEDEALRDIEGDKAMRQPLPGDLYFVAEGPVRKGGINRGPSQVKERPAAPGQPLTSAGKGWSGFPPPKPRR